MYAQVLASSTKRRGTALRVSDLGVSVLSSSSQTGRVWGGDGSEGNGPERCRWVSRLHYYRLGQGVAPSSSAASAQDGAFPHARYRHTLSYASCLQYKNTALAIINIAMWASYGFYSLVVSEYSHTLTAILILEQKVPLDFCSDMPKVRALHTGTPEDWRLPQLVKFYTSLDCPQTLLEGRGPEKGCAGRPHILVNCLSGYG